MEAIIMLALVGAVVYAFIQYDDHRDQKKRALLKKYGHAGPPPSHHCMTCGSSHSEPAEGPQRGNTYVELALWLFFFPAGAVYSFWRRKKGAGGGVCPVCKSTSVVPIDSPAAKAHIRRLADG